MPLQSCNSNWCEITLDPADNLCIEAAGTKGGQLMTATCNNQNYELWYAQNPDGSACAPFPGAWCQLKNEWFGECISLQNASSANNTPVVMWPCGTGAGADEKWQFNVYGSSGNVQMQNYQTQHCVGIYNDNVTSGQPLIEWSCNGNSDQHWVYLGHL
jgi:hypothetical protein